MSESRSAPGAPDHRLDDAVAYHHNELDAGARAEFEEHLKICAGCRKAVATADVLFPNLPAALQPIQPRRTTEELLEIMDQEQRRIDAESAAKHPRKAPFRPRWHLSIDTVVRAVAVAVIVLLLAAVALLLYRPKPGGEIYAPKKSQRVP